jgi:hypothetical protein
MMVGNNEWQEHVADDDGINKEGRVATAMLMATRVAGKKEGEGDEEDDGISDKGGVGRKGQW